MDSSTPDRIALATLLARHSDDADEIERPPGDDGRIDGYVFSQLTVARLQRASGNVQFNDVDPNSRAEFVLDAQLHYIRARRDYSAETARLEQHDRENAIAGDVDASVTVASIAETTLAHMRAVHVADDDAAAAAYLAGLSNQFLVAAQRIATRASATFHNGDPS